MWSFQLPSIVQITNAMFFVWKFPWLTFGQYVMQASQKIPTIRIQGTIKHCFLISLIEEIWHKRRYMVSHVSGSKKSIDVLSWVSNILLLISRHRYVGSLGGFCGGGGNLLNEINACQMSSINRNSHTKALVVKQANGWLSSPNHGIMTSFYMARDVLQLSSDMSLSWTSHYGIFKDWSHLLSRP